MITRSGSQTFVEKVRSSMDLELDIVNPLTYPGWDDLLSSHPDSSFFHSSQWARVLCDSYHYRPLYFALIDRGRLSALVPVMEVKSFLTGTRGVSLPFTDYCDPIIPEKRMFRDIMDSVLAYGSRVPWDSIEIRSGSCFPEELPGSSYWSHTLDLSRGEDQLLSHFRDSTRRNIKKATGAGIQVSLSNSRESMDLFYRMNCRTRKEHGLPPQPYSFFKNLYEHVISKDLGFIALATHNGRDIAGAVYLYSRERVIYKYGASLRSYQHLRANNLVMWEAIRRCSQQGYTSLCFGRTEPENTGLRQFKNGWGAAEAVIKYHKYDFHRRLYVEGSSRASGYHNRIFRNAPIPLLKAAGYLLYRHMG